MAAWTIARFRAARGGGVRSVWIAFKAAAFHCKIASGFDALALLAGEWVSAAPASVAFALGRRCWRSQSSSSRTGNCTWLDSGLDQGGIEESNPRSGERFRRCFFLFRFSLLFLL